MLKKRDLSTSPGGRHNKDEICLKLSYEKIFVVFFQTDKSTELRIRPSFDLKRVGKILGSTVGGTLTKRGEYSDMVIVIFVRMPCELSPKAVSVLCSFL